jgi:tetratricopeptide (TPR) repeat protein
VSTQTGSAAGRGALNDAQLQKALQALQERKPQVAESLLRRQLEQEPDNVAAMTLLAETILRFDRTQEADELLTRSLEIAPDFIPALYTHVTVLLTLNRPREAFDHIAKLLELEPGNLNNHSLKAMAHAWVGDHVGAAAEYEIVLASAPPGPGPWLAYAHTLRTLGRGGEAVAAYRKACARFPKLGEPWWSLANLKTFRFTDEEVATMQSLLAMPDLPVESKVQINFALGRALEDRKDFPQSFRHYSEGNSLKRATLSYNAEMTSVYVQNCKTLFSSRFLDDRQGWGCKAADPIFIVGLPRSGSTLIEQILSSHSKIEGTMELRVVPYLVGRAGANRGQFQARGGQAHPALSTDSQAPYPETLRNYDASMLQSLGEEYLERSRVHRTLGRPFFIDKMPDNFAHIGLIHLILPNAKIIDARRHPLACCFSNFKQYFPLGKDFSYGLSDLGRYYADYVELMAHFDRVLPGKIHRVYYERVIADPEGEIRHLFEYLGLPFEEQALRFHETSRPVRTASSEQVRMPIFTDGLDQWRHYEQWLEPLKIALGPSLSAYESAPKSGK